MARRKKKTLAESEPEKEVCHVCHARIALTKNRHFVGHDTNNGSICAGSGKLCRAPKIGRPRTAKEIRVSRGVRLDPALIARADSAVEVGYAGVSNFTQVVECALTDWLHQFDKSASGWVSRTARAK